MIISFDKSIEIDVIKWHTNFNRTDIQYLPFLIKNT